jgi:hypothetical protein
MMAKYACAECSKISSGAFRPVQHRYYDINDANSKTAAATVKKMTCTVACTVYCTVPERARRAAEIGPHFLGQI